MRTFISIILLLAVLFTLFQNKESVPFLTDGVSSFKDYRDFAEHRSFKSVCWVKCGHALFTGGIIGYDGDYAIVLTTGHGFQNILSQKKNMFEKISKDVLPVVAMGGNHCVIGFNDITPYQKTFSASHVIFNPTYVRLMTESSPHEKEDQSSSRACDYALLIVSMNPKDQKNHPPLALPSLSLTRVTPAQFCGYGTHDKNKRAFGLFGGEHETIFPNLHKALLICPFFDPSLGASEDNLVKEWETLGKIPTGRAEPGDSGAPILTKQKNGHFMVIGVVQGIQFQGDPKALKTASIKEQFENVSTTVAPIVSLKKDGTYHLSKTFKNMLNQAKAIVKAEISS